MCKLKKWTLVLIFLFSCTLVAAQELPSHDTTVYDQAGNAVGFVDERGLYHEFMPAGLDISALNELQVTGEPVLKETEQIPEDIPLTVDEFAWPMFQCNRQHNGYLPVTLDPERFSLKWQKAYTLSSPVVAADGFVVFTSGGTLCVLDAVDGEVMWSNSSFSGRHVGHPSYGYGNVYIQTCNHSSDTWLHAFDAMTGDYVFKSGTSAQWENYYSPTLYDGKAYINGGYYGGMYGYDAFTGQRLWFRSLNQYDEWTPAVDDQHAYAYIGESCYGCNNAGLNIVDCHTGTLIKRITDPGFDWHGWSMNLAPVLGTMDDVFAIQDGRLLCFDIANYVLKYLVSGSFTRQPVVAEGQIYAINGGKLEVRDEMDGTFSWGWQPPEGSLSGYLAVTDSHVFARTSSNTYAVDLFSQEAAWSHPAFGSFALADETLYIAGGGYVTAIAAEEQAPSNPLALEIEGPEHVLENSQVEYKSIVHYDDGRLRYRTLRTEWSVEPNEWAAIDDRAVLETGELVNPEEQAAIIAAYTENDVTLTTQKQIQIVIDCNLAELISRNLTKAIEGKEQILSILDSILCAESATARILRTERQERFWHNGPRPYRNTLARLTLRAILCQRLAQRWINSGLEALKVVDSLLSNENPQLHPQTLRQVQR